MARVSATKGTTSNAVAVTSLSVAMPTHSAGDLLLVAIQQYSVGATLSTTATGWAKAVGVVTTSGNSSSCALFYKVATSSAEPSITVTSSDATAREMTAIALTVIDVDTTTPINVTASLDQNSAQKHASATTVTTTSSNCLVLNVFCPETYNRGLIATPPVITEAVESDESRAVMSITSIQQQAAGTTPTFNVTTAIVAVQYSEMVIAINSAAGVAEPAIDFPVTQNIDMLAVCQTASTSNYNISATFDPTMIIGASTIDGETFNYIAPGTANTITNIKKHPVKNSLSSYSNSASGRYKVATGGMLFTAAMNFTNKLIIGSVGHAVGPRDAAPWDHVGVLFGLTDGTNLSFWKLSGVDSSPSLSGQTLAFCIDPTQTPYWNSGTAINVASVTGFCLATYRGYNTHNVAIGSLYSMDISAGKAVTLMGGSTGHELSFSILKDISDSSGFGAFLYQAGVAQGQFTSAVPLQIGNGTDTTITDFSNQSLVFANAYSATSKYGIYHIPQGALFFSVKASSTDTIKTGSCVIDMANYHIFKIDTASSASATYDFVGLVILNATVQLANITGLQYKGISFSGCKELTTNGADLSGGNTISNCVDPQAVTVTNQTDFHKLDNCTFSNNAVAIKITGNQAGTWTDPRLTVSGNIFDIEYTGTTNFSIQSTTALTVNNTSTGVLTIVTPKPTLTITGFPAGASVVINDLDSADPQNKGTELKRVDNATADVTYQGAAGNLVLISMIEPGYKVFEQQYTIGATDAVFTIVPEQETN